MEEGRLVDRAKSMVDVTMVMKCRVMTDKEMAELRAEAAEEMAAVDDLHRRFAAKVEEIFGISYQLYREFNVRRNSWEWTILSKYLGMRARFDVEISADKTGDPSALDHLIAQLPDQMQHWAERQTAHDNPMAIRPGYFAIDRRSTQGIVNPKIVIHPELLA
jgi:hypothetical protein